ncbi:MAG: cytochrome c oxidase subunit II [Robiginitomaculum sp.]|nr:MAG: cytochrome c oxidase subunit II [Robiginitomaculum sp.]
MRFSPFMKASGLAIATLSFSALTCVGTAFAESNKDGPTDGDIGFQRAVTPVMEAITGFNNFWLVPIMVGIVVLVTVLMGYIMIRFREKANPEAQKFSHHTGLEVAWTLIPVVILMCLAVPSMKLLYFADVVPEAGLVVKATGNTWNWEYSYPDYEDKVDSFVSNIVDIPHTEKRTEAGEALSHKQIIAQIEARPADQPRLNGRPYLMATDAALVVPVDTIVKVLVTSNNNLHAFAVPQFGVKIDAVPGRINETWFKVNVGEEGTYYGQCSEICGVNHAFMPIEVKVVSKAEFKRWVANGGSFTAQYSQNTIQNKIVGGMQTAAAQ